MSICMNNLSDDKLFVSNSKCEVEPFVEVKTEYVPIAPNQLVADCFGLVLLLL